MKVKLLYFGQITELVQRDQEDFELPKGATIDVLYSALLKRTPALNNIEFKMALNHNLVENDCVIEAGSEIAILPPFAGG